MADLRGTLLPPGTLWIGRADVLGSLIDVLERAPGLTTLRGPGGAGKTRTALEAAAAVGLPAWGCALENAHTADDMVALVAGVLGRDGVDADAVGAALADLGPALLVLDNLEQLDDDAGRTVGAWRRAAPQLRLLATSRRRIGLQAERVIDLGALPSDEAVALFVERVRRRRSAYDPDDAERHHIVTLCDRLDRLPLAVELAAGRAATLGLTRVLDRLGPQLGDGALDRAPRHATLEATVRWSWDLLDPADREVLAAAALLPGPLRPEALGWLGDDVDLALARLADVSLLRTLDTSDGALVWAHYEVVRAWAVRHVTPAARARCVRGLLDLPPDRDALLALADATEAAGETDLLVDLALALDPVLFRTGPEARRRALLHTVRETVPESDPRHTEALVSLAMTGLEPALIEPLRRAEARTDDPATRGRAALALCQEAFDRSDMDEAARWADRARASADRAGAVRVALGARFLRAGVHAATGDGRAARQAYDEALAYTRVHDGGDEALILGQLGSVALDVGDDDAASLLEAAIAGLEGDHRQAMSLAKLAEARLEQGDLLAARAAAERGLQVLHDTSNLRFEGYVLGFLGLVEEAEGEADRARATLERAEVANRGKGHPVLGAVIACWRGRLDADAGLPDSAHTHLDRAAEILDGGKLAPLVDLCRAHVALRAGDLDAVRAAVEAVADGAPASEVRLAAARLSAAAPAAQLSLGPDAAWFRAPDSDPVDLSARHPIRRVLAALVDAHDDRTPLDVEALFEAGWPGETAVLKARRNRVYHAVRSLRKWGLEDWLQRTEEGWLLSPDVQLVREPDTTRS